MIHRKYLRFSVLTKWWKGSQKISKILCVNEKILCVNEMMEGVTESIWLSVLMKWWKSSQKVSKILCVNEMMEGFTENI